MTIYHTPSTTAACADPRVRKALGPCTCDGSWRGRGMCSPNCGLCQYGEDVLAVIEEIEQECKSEETIPPLFYGK